MGKTMKTIRQIQETLPWSIAYSEAFQASPLHYKDFQHALVHVVKAAGKLAAMIDDHDHGRVVEDPNVPKYLADLVICSIRMANVAPGGKIDLQEAVEARISQKNGTPR